MDARTRTPAEEQQHASSPVRSPPVNGETARAEPDLHALAPAAMAHAVSAGRTMLLVIDMQVDFASPDGALGRGGLDLSGVAPALERIARLLASARAAGVPVGFTRVVTRPDTDSRALQLLHRRTGRDPSELEICREGTEGAEQYGVHPQPGDLLVDKRLYSAFHDTVLGSVLDERGIDTLVVAGMTTECCVDSTVRDAFHRDLGVFLVADACTAYDRPAHVAALRALGSSFAVLVDAATVIAGWQHGTTGRAGA